jgi:ribose transport system substrate-binding protein
MLIVGGLAAVAVSACGSDDAGNGGSTAAASADTATQSTTSTSSPSGVVADCGQMIAKAKNPLEFKAPGGPIDATKLKGKRVTVISLGQSIPAIADLANQTKDAGEEVGIPVDIFDAKGDVRRMQQGMAQAVTTKSSAIILIGVPTDINEAALSDAAAAKIPVISELNNEPEPDQPGQGGGEKIFASTAPSYFEAGQLLACKAVVDTSGKANVAIFGAKELKPSAKEVEGMRSILEKCDGCSVSENTTQSAEWQTRLPGLAQSEIRKSPDLNYHLPLYDGMGIFVAAGVSQAGAGDKVKVATFNAAPAGLELVKQGPSVTADPGQPPGWMAWAGLDQAMRGMLGEPPAAPRIPIRFFDQENLASLDVKDQDALFGSEYKDGFRKLWGQ